MEEDQQDDRISAWEYIIVTSGTVRKGSLLDRLNEFGRLGWEVVGFAQSDRTLGINSLEVLMKRPLGKTVASVESTRTGMSPLCKRGDHEYCSIGSCECPCHTS